jgi:hypothetical protein
MPVGNWNLQWLNHNSQRSYPLTETATKTDITGTIRLPDSFIVGLYLPISATVVAAPTGFFISSVLISAAGFNIYISCTDSNGGTVDVAAANIPRAGHTRNKAYAIGGVDAFSDTIGQIVLGDLAEVDRLPPGYYTFNSSDGLLEFDAIRPNLRGVSSLQVVNNNDISDFIYGDVVLVAGANMRIDVSSLVDGRTEITFKAIAGENLNDDCGCNTPVDVPCIKCINGVCTSDGNFTFAYDECVDIQPTNNGLIFSDTCASPCCGCAELDAITNQINRFSDGVATLQNFVTRLGSEVSQMSLVVLGSRLGDSGCTAG